jgi:hypothetical protein
MAFSTPQSAGGLRGGGASSRGESRPEGKSSMVPARTEYWLSTGPCRPRRVRWPCGGRPPSSVTQGRTDPVASGPKLEASTGWNRTARRNSVLWEWHSPRATSHTRCEHANEARAGPWRQPLPDRRHLRDRERRGRRVRVQRCRWTSGGFGRPSRSHWPCGTSRCSRRCGTSGSSRGAPRS